MDIPSEFLNNSALAASKALNNDMRSALAASKALNNDMRSALAASKALDNDMRSALAASKALDNDMRSALAASLPTSMSRTARRLYDSPALKAWQEALGSSVKIDDSILKAAEALANNVKIDDSILKAAEALANNVKYEHPSAPANPPVDALASPLPPADLEDTPDGVLGVATAKMLMRLRAWGDLCAELGRLCDDNVEGLDAGRLEVARQIDECLSCLVMTAGSGGVCWSCEDATLMSHGVVCADCAAPVAQMVLESWFLTEGLEPD